MDTVDWFPGLRGGPEEVWRRPGSLGAEPVIQRDGEMLEKPAITR